MNNRNMMTGRTVHINDQRDFNRALRKWKKKVDESKVLMEYQKRTEYTKPSETRKKEQAAARARLRRAEAKQQRQFKPHR